MATKSLTRPLLALVAVAALLSACAATQEPLSGSQPLKNGKGRLIDPVYGTPLPGQYSGF